MAISKFKPYHQDLVSDRLSTRKGRMALALDMYPFGLANPVESFSFPVLPPKVLELIVIELIWLSFPSLDHSFTLASGTEIL